jgi:hypothetical protein
MPDEKHPRSPRMRELLKGLSPEGQRLFDELEALEANPETGEVVEPAELRQERRMRALAGIDALPEASPDREVLDLLFAEKQRMFAAKIERMERETNDFRWLAARMQEEGLRRGLDKEARERMTLQDFIEGPGKGEEA